MPVMLVNEDAHDAVDADLTMMLRIMMTVDVNDGDNGIDAEMMLMTRRRL